MAASPEQANSPNDVNDLFDYDVGLDEIWQGTTANADASNASKPAEDQSGLGLGLDEEVKITKQRKPVAKLDEGRLLSQPGIPKLRRAAKQKLKFKGRGHEFSDAARLLNFYQLWLDDLFPRAKFADGLAMIEKLGHTKRIQIMRREWIDEEKRKLFDSFDVSQDAPETRDLPTRISSEQNGTGAAKPDDPPAMQQDHAGLGSADDLFIPDPVGASKVSASHPEPDDDDLEDLLREQDGADTVPAPSSRPPPSGHDDFEDEYEAMNELGI